jgi:hypothetical protein
MWINRRSRWMSQAEVEWYMETQSVEGLVSKYTRWNDWAPSRKELQQQLSDWRRNKRIAIWGFRRVRRESGAGMKW